MTRSFTGVIDGYFVFSNAIQIYEKKKKIIIMRLGIESRSKGVMLQGKLQQHVTTLKDNLIKTYLYSQRYNKFVHSIIFNILGILFTRFRKGYYLPISIKINGRDSLSTICVILGLTCSAKFKYHVLFTFSYIFFY